MKFNASDSAASAVVSSSQPPQLASRGTGAIANIRHLTTLSFNEREDEERAEASRAAAAAAAAKRERDAQGYLDDAYSDIGYENVGDNVYFRWLDADEYNCGRWDCGGFSVVAEDGCPGGLYLEAAIMSGGVQVGWTNETFSGLGAGDSAADIFEMVTADGDSFQLTEVSCHSW